ncbi:hypothetical protein ACVWZL_009044 [Bradyrhizobium sp. GM2.4]
MFRQGDDDCIKVADRLITRIIAPLLLLAAKNKPVVLDESDRSVVRQLDTADAHSASMFTRKFE